MSPKSDAVGNDPRMTQLDPVLGVAPELFFQPVNTPALEPVIRMESRA